MEVYSNPCTLTVPPSPPLCLFVFQRKHKWKKDLTKSESKKVVQESSEKLRRSGHQRQPGTQVIYDMEEAGQARRFFQWDTRRGKAVPWAAQRAGEAGHT